MTRSSKSPLFESLKEPERRIRKIAIRNPFMQQGQPSKSEPEELNLDLFETVKLKSENESESDHESEQEDKIIRIMAENNLANLSLEEYASRRTEDEGPGLVRPEIPEDKSFEIKGQFLHLLLETPFTGKESENANEHIEAVCEIADYFHIPGVTKDAVMLRVFPITLQGPAKRWLKSLPARSIQTWDQLKKSFIKQFSPPSKIAKLKMKIQNFHQEDDETLYDAWDRYKELLQKCPQHDLNPHQVVQTFYNGINVVTRQMVDSQGPIPKKTPAEGYALIEELAQHSHQWHSSSRDAIYKKKVTFEDDAGIPALNAKIDSLTRDVKKVNQNIQAIQIGCDNCQGPHFTKDCPVKQEVSATEEVCYSSGDRLDEWKPRFNRNQNSNWKPYAEYIKDKNEKYKQSGPGFYQKIQNDFQQPEKNLTFDEMITQFAVASEKRHTETEEALKRISTVTETAVKNLQASILNIEKQVGQMSNVLQERFPGTLPSFTENNPKQQANAVITRTGEKSKPLVPISDKEIEKDNKNKKEDITKTDEKDLSPIPEYKPKIPFPERLKKQKQDEQYRKFLDHIKTLHINIPFIEAVVQMPKYAKFLKDLITNRKKMEEVSSIILNEECSAAMLNRIPKKANDPGSLTLPCQFGNLPVSHALADSGASINLMPYSFYTKLELPELKPTRMAIHLANKSVTYPRGIVEDLLVKIDKFVFPVDFVVIDMEEDDQIPIILGRPFLSTARALVDIHDSKLTLRVGTDTVTFGINKSMEHSKTTDDSVYYIDVFDDLIERIAGTL